MPIGEYALLCVPACDLPFKVIGGRCFLVENFAKGAWADTNHWCGYYGATLAKLDDASVFAALVQEIKDSGRTSGPPAVLPRGERAKGSLRRMASICTHTQHVRVYTYIYSHTHTHT